MADQIDAGIASLTLPGEPGQLREAARQVGELVGELHDAHRVLAETDVPAGGRLHRFHDSLFGLVEAGKHSLQRDAGALDDVRDRVRELARVLEEGQAHEVPAILRRWQRIRAEAVSGGPRADERVAEVERDLVEQYRDVLDRLGGRALVHDIEQASWVQQPRPGAPGDHDGQGHGDDGGRDHHHVLIAEHLGRDDDPEGRVQVYRHTLAGVLEDLDAVVRRWRAVRREVAQALHSAQPTDLEVAAHGARAVAEGADHDSLAELTGRLEQAGLPLKKADDVLRAALANLRDGRSGHGGSGGTGGRHDHLVRWDPAEDGEERDALERFQATWTQHLDDLGQRLRRTTKRIDDLREQVRALDEKFAATLLD